MNILKIAILIVGLPALLPLHSCRKTLNGQSVSLDSLGSSFLSGGGSSTAGVAVGNNIFFGGYEAPYGIPSDKVDIYNILTNVWTRSHLSVARTGLTAGSAGDVVVFEGGAGR
jgi:hypothetical protein